MIRIHILLVAYLTMFSVAYCQRGIEMTLPESFGPGKAIRDIVSPEFKVTSLIDIDGDLTVKVCLENISTKSSRTSGLPNKLSVRDWTMVLVVVPRLSETDLRDIEQTIVAFNIGDDQKGKKVSLTDLRKNVPDIFGNEYAYRVLPTMNVPTEESDIKKIEDFLDKLLKSHRMRGAANAREKLHTRVLR